MSLLNQLPESNQKGWPWAEEVDAVLYSADIVWPKISIVTPSYNQGGYIEETIRSILLQNYPNLEYIIIDGGSTDETSGVIEQYAPWITYWISEKDNGQANAINKGLKITTGHIFNWINSDDFLARGALKAIGLAFLNSIDMLAGVVNNFHDSNALAEPDMYFGLQKNNNLSLKQYFNNGGFYFHQPGLWLKRSLLDDERLNESLHYCFDTELLFKLLENNPVIVYTDKVLVNFRLHQNSKTTAYHARFLAEFEAIHIKYAQHANKAIACMAKQYNSRVNWMAYLNNLQQTSDSKLNKVRAWIKGVFEHPLVRINRFSIGALKKIISS